MPYRLGGITLPRPKSVVREIIELARENNTLAGLTHKNTLHRKERYILSYVNISLAVVTSIQSEYELDLPRTFQIDEGELQIGPVDVLIDFSERLYPPVGKTYVENFKLVLTEVK